MLATALAPEIGYDAAAALAKDAFKLGRTIRELAIERGIAADRLDELLDPAAMTSPGWAGDPPGADRRARPPRRPTATIRAMSEIRAWDRAGPPVRRVRPPAARGRALRAELPTVDELFTFMRDAEHRFGTLRMRIEEHAWTARGEEIIFHDVSLRHPGEAKVLTSTTEEGSTDSYEAWVSDGTTVQTYVASRKLATRRPVRATVRGVAGGRDLPGRSRFYVPLTALQAESLPELFIHPAGYCQNVLATGAAGSRGRRPSRAARRSCSSAITRGRSR